MKKSESLESKQTAALARSGGAYRRFMKMTPAQRQAEVAEYDREDLSTGKPLTVADKALHRRAAAKAKVGRPKVGQGAKIVPVTIERGLLKEADAYAKRHGLKRSQMVAEGLKLILRKAG